MQMTRESKSTIPIDYRALVVLDLPPEATTESRRDALDGAKYQPRRPGDTKHDNQTTVGPTSAAAAAAASSLCLSRGCRNDEPKRSPHSSSGAIREQLKAAANSY